ncbi:MAG: adenosylcobinamide-GDP ribazoletransferase, partial [Deltaproteobacteria bacterium]|nr:adenosylcobinamide-GDP ribazoletransferase [Deltaproteobacteria bacterium]
MTFPPPVRALRAAFVFLTRLQVGGFPYSADDFRWSTAHFPIVGVVVGAIGAGVLGLALPLGPDLAALLALCATVYCTGAFHEDGLADTLDALGGAHSKKKVLEILKDSRIGTYGGAALVLSLTARFLALASLTRHASVTPYGSVPASLLLLPTVHALARIGPVFLMRFLPYASEEGAKGASVAEGGKTPQLIVA